MPVTGTTKKKIFFIRGLPDKKESKDDIKSNVYRY
jgi:hypothetical protein